MSPVAELCVTIFTGFLGGHYFVKGKVGLGILYLLTFGLFGIGWIVDCVKAAMEVYTISKSKTEKVQTETGNFLWVTGVHYYLDNIQKLATLNREYSASVDEIISHGKAGRRIFKYYYANIPIELIPEPQNPH
ncbi:MAG: TM2 domain-containing protein, partial [Ruthenibacterium sp.]